MIYIFTLVLAFCSIVYELLLGQILSAFLGNTVLRYSVTIGLYLFSMGVGAIIAEGRFTKHPIITLQRVEILLTLLGSLSMALLHVVDWLSPSDIVLSLVAHSLIILIGILTGFEIPLLMVARSLEKADSDNIVLGIDYLGAFIGTIAFAFVFYPLLGLVTTALFVALLNALVGALLITQQNKVGVAQQREHHALIAVQACLFVLLIVGLVKSSAISEGLLQLYLRG